MIENIIKNPITLKRIKRFKEMKRAYVSFWILALLYLLSLGAEFICNSDPLYVRYNGRSYFPVVKFYPEKVFTENGRLTRPDYKQIHQSDAFQLNGDNFMIFAPVPFGPYESINPESLGVADQVTVRFETLPDIATVNIRPDFRIYRAYLGEAFWEEGAEPGAPMARLIEVPEALRAAVARRFANQASPRAAFTLTDRDGRPVKVSLSSFRPRPAPPETVRLTIREIQAGDTEPVRLVFSPDLELAGGNEAFWQALDPSEQAILLTRVESRFDAPVDPYRMTIDRTDFTISFNKADVRFPFAPVESHWLGIDGAGRDVLARIVYGLRTSLTFGFVLVLFSMGLGILTGALQGYYGGRADITAQRFIEIWSALPFLYIMILMGSIYGRSFGLLLVCYGLFNWIGISYYIRAEFLRLRKQPFVEAARCMGVSTYRIIFKHILPNALVPVITFFPFSLVGAIGALAALDYLGFGLPPPTPSWGELLFQAQQYRWAWWLILYPSLALFTVMLLGVFVGEGIRNAYDPKRYTRLE